MTIQGLIQAAGGGVRLGLGPKAFVTLGGTTLLERAVALLRNHTSDILIAIAPEDAEQARLLVGGDATIIPGGTSRSDTTRRLIAAAKAEWLILHDVVHPLATSQLVARVLAAAKGHGAAAPAIANTDFLYRPDGSHAFPPGALLTGQKPVAFARDLAERAYRDFSAENTDPSLMAVLEKAGIKTHFVDGDARNIKITNPGDLELAQALLEL